MKSEDTKGVPDVHAKTDEAKMKGEDKKGVPDVHAKTDEAKMRGEDTKGVPDVHAKTDEAKMRGEDVHTKTDEPEIQDGDEAGGARMIPDQKFIEALIPDLKSGYPKATESELKDLATCIATSSAVPKELAKKLNINDDFRDEAFEILESEEEEMSKDGAEQAGIKMA